MLHLAIFYGNIILQIKLSWHGQVQLGLWLIALLHFGLVFVYNKNHFVAKQLAWGSPHKMYRVPRCLRLDCLRRQWKYQLHKEPRHNRNWCLKAWRKLDASDNLPIRLSKLMVTKHSLSDSTQSNNLQLEDMRQTFQRFCCHKERFSEWSLANNLVPQKDFQWIRHPSAGGMYCTYTSIYPVVMVTVGALWTLQPFPSIWFSFQILLGRRKTSTLSTQRCYSPNASIALFSSPSLHCCSL